MISTIFSNLFCGLPHRLTVVVHSHKKCFKRAKLFARATERIYKHTTNTIVDKNNQIFLAAATLRMHPSDLVASLTTDEDVVTYYSVDNRKEKEQFHANILKRTKMRVHALTLKRVA